MGRILAVDLGTRRVGLALTDPLKMIASPYDTLSFTGEQRLVQELQTLAAEKGVERIVVGLPIREDGSEGEGCRKSRSLAQCLQAAGLAVSLWDERYSSCQAESSLREMGFDRRRAVRRVDPVAAAIILQDYLRASSSGE